MIAWHDTAKERRLAWSQPLRWREVDWVAVVGIAAAVLLTAAWVRALWLGVVWLMRHAG